MSRRESRKLEKNYIHNILKIHVLVKQVVTEVKADKTGIVKGFRTWTIQAFDSKGDLILELSKDYGRKGHLEKMFDFMELLHQKMFMLTDKQIEELADLLTLQDQVPELLLKSRELNQSVTLYVDCME